MNKPRITAEHITTSIRSLDHEISTPSVDLIVTFNHDDQETALAALEQAASDVAEQIRSTSKETR